MPGSPQTLRILLAEDNASDVFLVKLALSRAGINASLQILADGEQAIRFIDRLDADSSLQPFHLILLDFQLPRRDGLEVLDRIRASRQLRNVPVLFTTTSDRPEIRQAVIADARLSWFKKPSSLFEFMTLGPVVESLCQSEGATVYPASRTASASCL